MSRKNKDLDFDGQALSRDASASHYRSKRRRRGAGKAVRIILITLVIVILAAAGTAFAYVHLLNSKINSGIDESLKGSLSTTEDGEPFYMLLLGTDRDEQRSDSSDFGSSDDAYRSDSIMVARIDPANKKVALVSIHRDTLVDMGDNGRQKINAAYSIGGASYATEVISTFCGVPISHYAEIDMDGMAAIVDQVGGIDVNLPMDVKDPNYTGLDLSAGEQHLDGQTAALLCRARHAYDAYGDGDRFRAANQRIVMESVIEKILQSDAITMASTIQTMAGYVRTDMNVQSIVSLASQFVGMDVNTDITSAMEPTTSLYENGTWYEICNVSEWREMMQRVDQGLSPTASGVDDATVGVTATTESGAESGTAAGSGSSSSTDAASGSVSDDGSSSTGSTDSGTGTSSGSGTSATSGSTSSGTSGESSSAAA